MIVGGRPFKWGEKTRLVVKLRDTYHMPWSLIALSIYGKNTEYTRRLVFNLYWSFKKRNRIQGSPTHENTNKNTKNTENTEIEAKDIENIEETDNTESMDAADLFNAPLPDPSKPPIYEPRIVHTDGEAGGGVSMVRLDYRGMVKLFKMDMDEKERQRQEYEQLLRYTYRLYVDGDPGSIIWGNARYIHRSVFDTYWTHVQGLEKVWRQKGGFTRTARSMAYVTLVLATACLLAGKPFLRSNILRGISNELGPNTRALYEQYLRELSFIFARYILNIAPIDPSIDWFGG